MYKHARIVAVVMVVLMLSGDAFAGRFFSGRFRDRLRGRRRAQVVAVDQNGPLIVPTAPSITTVPGSVDILPRSVGNLPGINSGVSSRFLAPPGASVNPVTPMPMRVITPEAPKVTPVKPETNGELDFSDLTPPKGGNN